ncbi:MAG: rod shape-determining protein RodA [Magnetococcales bacterium]|nr:rod shape-determining protein RodA [Magnetococcales bacterium]
MGFSWNKFFGFDGDGSLVLGERLQRFPWVLLIFLTITVCVGLATLYSAVGGWDNVHLLLRQGARFMVGLALMAVIVLFGAENLYRRYAYILYIVVLLMLIGVAVTGSMGMGARRWLDLSFIRLQPSEFMKLAVVLALSRYFHDRSVSANLTIRDIWVPLLILAAPFVLIIKQPDLGTAVLVAAVGVAVIIVAGLPWKWLLATLVALGASLPMIWNVLHDYQKQRIMTLFFPERDPLGAGYHIIQSKIAVGSGGLTGKGFLGGSQSQLNFLPERHTDFIFSVLAEEWGFLGSVALLFLYALIILRGLYIASSAHNRFGLLLAAGVTALFGFQVVINLGMVIGLLPVVGIPLPLVSYGGSSMVTVMLSMGLLAHVSIHSKHHGRRVEPGEA